MTIPVSAADDEIHLSVVATTRNDDHGGDLTRRTQHFIDGLVAQCKRHALRAELILVEWNPPPERAPLIEELRWPADAGPCSFRIITVPPEAHRTIQHADKLRLFQMLAKNAGIRRARGKFVLATNIDILFSDDAVRYLRDRLRPGCVYLADRADVPADLPSDGDFRSVLRFCEDRAFRINAGGLIIERAAGAWRLRDRLKAAAGAGPGYLVDLVEKFWALAGRTLTNPRWAFRRFLGHGLAALDDGNAERKSRPALALVIAAGAWRVAGQLSKSVLRLGEPFTNACGDFTAMSREDWFRVRGYAEWHIFSWHLDTLLIFQALGCGIRARRLAAGGRVFHIDHSGGFAPDSAAALFARLESKGIPFITDQDLQRLYADIAQKKRAGGEVQFNEPGWGLAALALPESQPKAP